jgi:hypothetical protein
MKASIAYKTLDNITVVMLAFKNFKKALVDDFCQVNNIPNESHDEKESGAVNTVAHDERAPIAKMSCSLPVLDATPLGTHHHGPHEGHESHESHS